MIDFDALLLAPCQEAFGAPWEIRNSVGGSWQPITGIFDRRHIEALDQDGAAQTMRRATLFIRGSDLPPLFVVREGDLVRRGTETFVVTDPQPDAAGGILLILGARVGGPAAP